MSVNDKTLNCSICQDVFSDPRILPCGHTYCTECLEQLHHACCAIICPECRERCNTKPSALLVNFALKQAADQKKEEDKKTTNQAPSPFDGYQVFVLSIRGNTVVLSGMKRTNTIAELKKKVEERTGIKACWQRLLFSGKQLDDVCQITGRVNTLETYNIEKDVTIHLVMRLKGGRQS